MTCKQTYKNRLYKLSSKLLSGVHTDYGWEDLHAVFNNMRLNGYNVEVESTNYNGLKSKTYYFNVTGLEHLISGHITCSFCGSCESPMDIYDMSMVLY